MSDFYSANMAVIGLRWPALAERLSVVPFDALKVDLRQGRESTLLVEGIQLSSRHDRKGEAHLQAASLPVAPKIHLYGPGLGDLPAAFLERRDLLCLEVRILNEAMFVLLLHLLDHTYWLDDPRVLLALAGDAVEIGLPFFASPPELVLASDHNSKIRDRLVAEIGVDFANSRLDKLEPELAERLASNRSLVARDRDVAELFSTRPGSEAWVIATGPSLASHYEHLRSARAEGRCTLMIAVDTAFRPLLEQGIRPDIVVSADHLTTARTLPAEFSDDLPLVYFPLLDNALLLTWRGPRYAAYAKGGRYDAMRCELPRASLFADGSVLHPAVDLAVRMGATKICLFGADFAHIGGQAHAGWQPGILAPKLKTSHWVLNGRGERVATLLNLRAYLCSLERYIAGHPEVAFLNTCREGAWIEGTQYDEEFTR